MDNIVANQLEIYLEQNPAVAKIIIEKSVLSQRARDAARKARDLTRRKTALEECLFLESWQIVWIKTRLSAKFTS